MIIGTAGHIDHGKTSLVKRLTGVDADRLPEEKARGITVDLGYAYVPLPDGEVLGYVDVPGHEKLIHNMLAGATGIDFVLLVVAADDGPMPQTREHLEILDLLGLCRGAVALTKVDLVDQPRRSEVVAQIMSLLAGTALQGSPVFPVSAITGEGVDELSRFLVGQAAAVTPRSAGGRFRLAVDRCFTLSGAGTVVTGTAHSGEVRVGDRLLLSPPGIEVRVRGLHVQNRAAESGRAGQRCAVNITGPGFSREQVSRGDWLLDPAAHRPIRRLAARLQLLAREERALRHWAPVHVHLGASDLTGRVALLQGDSLSPGESAWAELVLDREVAALRGDRFVIRDQSAQRTLGGGTVLDIVPPARGKRTPAYRNRLAALEEPSPDAGLDRLLMEQPVNLDEFALQWNLREDAAEALYRAAPMVTLETTAGRAGVHRDTWETSKQAVLDILAAHHREHPDEAGLGREALRRATAAKLPRPAWEALLAALLAEGRVSRSGFLLRLPEHRAALTGAERLRWERILPLLLESPFQPPRVRDIARSCGLDEGQVRTVLRKAERLGECCQVAHDHFFVPRAAEQLAAILAELEREQGEARAAEFRSRIGTGRKLAIQILEFFDRIGYTRRAGDGHRLRSDAGVLFGLEAK
jgi:selenocysteine-specific elongation factor